MVDNDRILELLRQSRFAHEQFQHYSPRMVPGQVAGSVTAWDGDASEASRYLVEALRLRTEAHALDPQQTAPAWRGEPVHDALLDFYVQLLADVRSVNDGYRHERKEMHPNG